jgi:hypothetical protein
LWAQTKPQLSDDDLSDANKVIEKAFRNAIIVGRKMTLWVNFCRAYERLSRPIFPQ